MDDIDENMMGPYKLYPDLRGPLEMDEHTLPKV